MSARITAAERAALLVARAALESQVSAHGVVDTIVFGLGSAGLLQSPESAAEVERLRAERHSTNEALDDAVQAIAAKDQRIAELEERPLAWAEKLDAKSLDNLLITLSQAADYEPMSGAIDQIHEVLAGFRAAAAEAGEVR